MSRGRKRVAFVGATEKGKSTQVKEMLTLVSEKILIHDPNFQKAYDHVAEISLDMIPGMQSGMYKNHEPDYQDFFEMVDRGFQGGTLVAEDASNYLGAHKDMKIFPLIIGLRHPNHNVDIIFVFHSLSETPKYIFRQLNEVILFKTGDNWNDVKDRPASDKVKEFRKCFDRVNAHKSQYHWERFILSKTGTL